MVFVLQLDFHYREPDKCITSDVDNKNNMVKASKRTVSIISTNIVSRFVLKYLQAIAKYVKPKMIHEHG